MLKKCLSVLLSLVMLCSIFGILPLSVSAQEADIAEVGANAEIAETGITQDQAVQWIKDRAYEGWWQNVDGVNGCQCVDLIQAYYQFFGYERLGGNAGDYMYNHLPSGSDWYYSDTPIPGSVFVRNYDDNYYPYGHVGLVYAVDSSTMYTVETNVVSPYDGGSNSSARYRERSVWFANRFINPTFTNPVPPTPQGHVMSESEGAGQTIPDGDYWICSRMAQDYFLDIPGTDYNTQSGVNLQMWDMDSELASAYDVFHIKYLNNNFYQITQMNTNMAVDVEGASLYRGTNVQMWEINGSNAQQWSIEKADKGYKLRARCNNYYMDINDAAYSSGTNVKTWEGWDGDCQLFSFILYAPDERPLPDGIYTIGSALANTCFLDVSGIPGSFAYDSNIQIWNSTDYISNPDEKYRFEYAGSGYYRIYEISSNLLMEIHNIGSNFMDKNANVKLYAKTDSRGQLWKIRKNTDGTFFFISQLSGYYLDAEGASTDNGTNVSQYMYNGTNAQRWKPLRVLQADMVTVNDVVITSDAASVNPSVTVKVDNKTLTKNTDYTVDVSADIAGGNGTVTVTGKGNYSGTVTKPFKITINDTTVVNDFFGNKFETEKGEIITYYANLTSPINVNHLNGVIYYNQEVLEPIMASDISYNAPAFDNGNFMPMGAGQIRFDVYSNKPISLNNVMVIRMQFRVIKKGGETWLGHQFETPEFTYENRANYELDAHILTDQVIYDPSKMILGDANGDGEVDSVDATIVQRAATKIQVPYSEDQLMCADIDGDGSLSIVDATFLQRYSTKVATPYKIGEVI